MTRDETIKAMLEDGASYAEIGKHVGLSRQRIGALAKAMGVKRPRAQAPDNADNATPSEMAELAECNMGMDYHIREYRNYRDRRRTLMTRIRLRRYARMNK